MFHTARQYCPVDSIATSVTWQFFSQVRSCFKSRVNVRKVRLRISASGLPIGGKIHTVTFFLCTSMPQQRRYFLLSISAFLVDRRAKDAWKTDKKTFLHVFIR